MNGFFTNKILIIVFFILFLLLSFYFLYSEKDKAVLELPAGSEVIYVVDVFRHGARTPIEKIHGLTYPSIWARGNVPDGQLTMLGFFQIRQMAESAKSFFDKYAVINKHKPFESLFVRTTGSYRTIMSATAYLSGIFPDRNMIYPLQESVQLHSVKKQDDHVLLPVNDKPDLSYRHAKGWKKYWEEVAYDDYDRWYRINPNFFTIMDEHFQKNCLDAMDILPQQAYECLRCIRRLSDNVRTLRHYCAISSHDCSAEEILSLDGKAMEAIDKHFAWVMMRDVILYPQPSQYGFQDYFTAYQYNAEKKGLHLIREIIGNFDRINRGQSALKLSLYSTHDITLLNILSFMLNNERRQVQPTQVFPDYAAVVRFIFYKRQGKLYALVLYYPHFDSVKPVTIFGEFNDGVFYGLPFAVFKSLYY